MKNYFLPVLILILIMAACNPLTAVNVSPDMVEPIAPPVMPKITFPATYQDVSDNERINITWESSLAEDVTYSLSYSTDGSRFDQSIATGLKSSEFSWQPRGDGMLLGWIKLKAHDSRGTLVAEDTVPVSYIPPTSIVVSKADQKVFHFMDGSLKHVFICSTALPQYDLKPGRYKVYCRVKKHWSKKYEVWMPHTLFFHQGYALHATNMIRQLGRPASHGCIRLHPKDAKTLYEHVSVGTPVIVLPKSMKCSFPEGFQVGAPPKPQPLLASSE